MSRFNYTEREWNYLIRQGDPEGRLALDGDLADWKPRLERLCARHALAVNGEWRMRPARNTAFLTDDIVIKIFARRPPIWFAREVECLQLVSAAPEAKTPKLLAYGDTLGDEDPDRAYLIMERLPGEEICNPWDTLSLEEKCDLVSQLALMLRALHATPVEGLRAFGRSPAEWVERMQARAAVWVEDVAAELPPYLAAQVPQFLAENLPYVTEEFHSCLMSADVHVGHILIAKRGGAWVVTGHIDLGDAEVGPVEYEWVSLCQKAFRGDEAMMRAFFAAYGQTLPVPPDVKRRIKLYTLLHRFPPLRSPPQDATEGPSLAAILDEQWPI